MTRNVKYISITRGYQVDFTDLSESEVEAIEKQLYDNELEISELSEKLGHDIENDCTFYEIQIDKA